MLIEPFRDGFWGVVMGLLCWAVTIVVSTMIIGGALWLVDSSFLAVKQSNGLVSKKYIIPEHTSLQPMLVGKVTVLIPIHHDTSYQICVTVNGLTDNVGLSIIQWDRISIGQTVSCSYTQGRIMNTLYVKSIRE